MARIKSDHRAEISVKLSPGTNNVTSRNGELSLSAHAESPNACIALLESTVDALRDEIRELKLQQAANDLNIQQHD